MFRQRNDFMRWMTWLTDSGADAEFKTREQRDRGGAVCCCAFWLAAHERRVLEHSDASDRTVSRLRRTAAEIAARYPAVSPDELARASAIVAPQIQELAAESANLGANVPAGGEALRGFIASGFASIPVLVSIVCGLISVLAVPGGLVTRALRHAVVRRDGREIGRARSAIRFLVAWSPALAWIACVGVPMFGEPRVSPDVALSWAVSRSCRWRQAPRGPSRFQGADRTTASPARGLCQGRERQGVETMRISAFCAAVLTYVVIGHTPPAAAQVDQQRAGAFQGSPGALRARRRPSVGRVDLRTTGDRRPENAHARHEPTGAGRTLATGARTRQRADRVGWDDVGVVQLGFRRWPCITA